MVPDVLWGRGQTGVSLRGPPPPGALGAEDNACPSSCWSGQQRRNDRMPSNNAMETREEPGLLAELERMSDCAQEEEPGCHCQTWAWRRQRGAVLGCRQATWSEGFSPCPAEAQTGPHRGAIGKVQDVGNCQRTCFLQQVSCKNTKKMEGGDL